MLHKETVAVEALDLIKKLSSDLLLKDFILVGGTALALQLGHRKSVDIDLFTHKDFDSQKLGEHIRTAYGAEVSHILKNGIFSLIGGIKTDMIAHQYKMLNPPVEIDGIRMASLEDIGAMKLHAIVNSGKRAKDFADMYYLLEHMNLTQLMSAYTMKYPERNEAIARNALLYNKDAKFIDIVDILVNPLIARDIKKRLKEAVLSPAKIFGSTAKENKPGVEKKPVEGQRKGIRRRH
ncbi:nucleotidyl transferase AbiEii/AbiGii toxin family protein [Puia dinghuensis]|uniref:Nucleotidyl transferase AbiEii/AbiGii toxin family protein n=1 Tax=Puia dinghuensis TaxID=1792502 RepID=A0A8J2UDU9_9BACT|nr:nucleotidyl transferase AbiEii/AbiGii toxin family protein [Puia dinghuensis]GGB01576.1 hypothetical protein GCM10011511_26110 [Puia dinghuensis]